MLVERVVVQNCSWRVSSKVLLVRRFRLMGCSIQTSDVDESARTYGPVLVPKDQGYQVGSDPLNRAGSIGVEAVWRWGKSAVAQITPLVDEAQSLNAPAQDLADRIASRFMHAVVCVAAVTCAVFIGRHAETVLPLLIDDLWKDQGYLPPIPASLVPSWCGHCAPSNIKASGTAFPGQDISLGVKASYKRLVPTWDDTVAAETHCCDVDHIQCLRFQSGQSSAVPRTSVFHTSASER